MMFFKALLRLLSAPILIVCSVVADAEDLTYEILENGVVVTGCIDTCPLQLDIPEEIDSSNVIGVGERAFRRAGIESVSLPDSLEFIELGAFLGNNLKSVAITEGVKTVGVGAFESNQLEEVTILGDLEVLEEFAFNNNRIAQITLPASLTQIGRSAFYGNKLAKIAIPDKVTTIDKFAFA